LVLFCYSTFPLSSTFVRNYEETYMSYQSHLGIFFAYLKP